MTSLRVQLYPMSPILGGWCEVCNLPSVVTVPLLLVDPETLRVAGRDRATGCTDHE